MIRRRSRSPSVRSGAPACASRSFRSCRASPLLAFAGGPDGLDVIIGHGRIVGEHHTEASGSGAGGNSFAVGRYLSLANGTTVAIEPTDIHDHRGGGTPATVHDQASDHD